MTSIMRLVLSRSTVAATVLALLQIAGCDSGSPGADRKADISGARDRGGTNASLSDAPLPGLTECYADRLLNAPSPFHLSWKLDDVEGHSDWEADVTANTIEGAWTSSAGRRKIHGIRSDLSSWRSAFAAFPLGAEAGHFRLLANSGAMTPAGRENVNGYATIKYVVDTSHVPAADAAVLKATLGEHGYIVGTAWADDSGCVVKFLLDEAWEAGNGTVDKTHLDVGMSKQ